MIEPRRPAHRAIFIGALLLALFVPHAARAGMFSAMVVGAGNPIVGSTVTVYAAGSSAAVVVGSGQTDSSGALSITISNPSGSAVLYAIATGGDAGHGTNPAIALMSAFGTASNYTSPIVINELTTVATVWSLRSFIHSGETIFGPSPGLQNAALTVTNLVGLSDGQPSAISTPDKIDTGQPACRMRWIEWGFILDLRRVVFECDTTWPIASPGYDRRRSRYREQPRAESRAAFCDLQ